MTTATTKQPRRAAYIDASAGLGVLDTGARLTGAPNVSLARIMRVLPPSIERVYLCGDRPGDGSLGGMLHWALEGAQELAGEWEQQPRGHYLPIRESGAGLEDEPVLRFQHRESGRQVDVRRMDVWLGDEAEYTPEDARATMQTLTTVLQQAFGPEAFPRATPAQTGKELWGGQKGLVQRKDYPPLHADLQRLIRATSGQGRIELCPPPAKTLPAFFYLDGKLMYGALVNDLGVGPCQHDTLSAFDPYQRGRYRIRFTIPTNWHHVGPFMVAGDPDGAEEERWQYPHTPRATYETWVDGAELWAMQQYQERSGITWQIEILERLLFTGQAKGHGPLHLWAKKLIELREGVPDRVASGQLAPRQGELLSAALRSMLLHGIGSFHRGGHAITRWTTDPARVPASAANVRQRESWWLWQEQEQLDRYSQQFEHPEWSAAIWARCRARLLYHRYDREHDYYSGALTLPREHIIAFMTDCIYASYLPEWARGPARIGQFRLKGRVDRPIKTPRSFEELYRLRDACQKGDNQWP
jgi:hypothetical protein